MDNIRHKIKEQIKSDMVNNRDTFHERIYNHFAMAYNSPNYRFTHGKGHIVDNIRKHLDGVETEINTLLDFLDYDDIYEECHKEVYGLGYYEGPGYAHSEEDTILLHMYGVVENWEPQLHALSYLDYKGRNPS